MIQHKNEPIQAFAPVNNYQRIDYMDLIRGIAVLGILIANLRWFTLYSPGVEGRFTFPHIDETVWFLQHWFIEGKFYSIFSLLFGWGIALQINRSKKDDKATAQFLRRRLSFMLLLGGIHLFFIWEGDIVFVYGLVGFVLIALRRFSNKTLLITGISLLLSPILLYLLKMNFAWVNWPSDMLYKAGANVYQHFGMIDQDTSRTDVIRESKSLLPILKTTWGDAPYRFAYLFFVSRLPKVLGAMLIGFVIGRTNTYAKVIAQKKKMALITILGLLIFIPLNYLLVKYLQDDSALHALTSKGLAYTSLYAFSVFPLALAYMLIVALIYENSVIHKLLQPILAVGKMAFTNYIMHSIVAYIIFYGIGFGWMEQLGPLAWASFGVILFVFQMLVSNIWLCYFKFGPIEWLWRSMTYQKIQPINK